MTCHTDVFFQSRISVQEDQALSYAEGLEVGPDEISFELNFDRNSEHGADEDEDSHHHLPLENIADNPHAGEEIEQVAQKSLEEMNEEEKQFYYFKQHDADDNDLLDGLELIQAVVKYEKSDPSHTPLVEAQLSEMVDYVLKNEDLDDDGIW